MGEALAEAIAQLALSLQDNERSAKIPFLSEMDADKYLQFKAHVNNQRQIYNWQDNKTKQNIVKHLSGQAALLAAHLTVQVNNQAITADAFIQSLDRIFIPMEQSPLAIAEIRSAKQKIDESIPLWHARCQSLYSRAFPDHAADDKNRIYSFVHGIQNKHIQEGILVREPATYMQALQFANTVTASLVHSGRITSESEEGSIQAMQARAGQRAGPMKCHLCAKMGHAWRSCELMSKCLTMLRQDRLRRQPQRQSRPPRPAGSNWGTRNTFHRFNPPRRTPFQGNRPRKVIAAVDEAGEGQNKTDEASAISQLEPHDHQEQDCNEDEDFSDFISALGNADIDDFLGLLPQSRESNK